jgi:FixJ family two-component response regulator
VVADLVHLADSPTVFIAEGDAATQAAIEAALRSVGLRTEVYRSAAELADRVPDDRPGCIILDVHLGGLTEPGARRLFDRRATALPVIVVTGQHDIATAVNAMRSGALSVLGLPFSEQTLIDDVHRAIAQSRTTHQQASRVRELHERYTRLTRREQEVMALLVTGSRNREIASTLGITERTVKAHRTQVMQKMLAVSFVDLLRMANELAGSDLALSGREYPVASR